ncbi:tail fiber domain-containing protein [Chryseobacterium sp.]|uniref:tail fiber domain-containing protein n=1 Tax=Chryseobacterium sp. TaxID=1871047 RepID=UPI002FCC86ED
MKKCFLVMLVSGMAYSQMGINTQTPQATLDVTAKTTDGTKPEGLMPPRLTGDQIKAGDAQYNAAQKGTLVYATSAVGTSSTKTANITAAGYYSFNGTLWEKFGGSTSIQDLRVVNTSSHITQDAGIGNNGTSSGSNCIFIGPDSGRYTTGADNIGIGPNSLHPNITGTRNIAIGSNSVGGNYPAPSVGVADNNVALGHDAMAYSLNYLGNTALGNDAFISGNVETEMVAIGRFAGTGGDGTNGTALGAYAGYGNIVDNKIFLGYKAAANTGPDSEPGGNNIIIGVEATPSDPNINNNDNEVTLGNPSNNSYRMFAASWTNASDRRLKHSIAPLKAGLDFVMSLKPSEYVYNNEEKELKTLGFIAQDVQESLKTFGLEGYKLINNLDSQYLGLNTDELIPVLAKAIQEQQEILQKIKQDVQELKK